MTRCVLKWNVPVDDLDHPVGSGRVLHVACQNDDYRAVQVWTDEIDADNVALRSARVFGTGQPVPLGDEPAGSVMVGALVWHVFVSSRTASPVRAVTG